MADTLAQLADEMAIRNLVARLARLADMSPGLEDYLACFTDDAIWEFSETSRAQAEGDADGMRLVGLPAIEANRRRLRATRFQGPSTRSFHLNTTLEVRVGQDGSAEAESYWVFVECADSPRIQNVGRYFDTFRRTPGGWKLAHRVVTPASQSALPAAFVDPD